MRREDHPQPVSVMFSILGKAIQLWIRHLPLIGPLVLTIWLPGHLFVGWSYGLGWDESTELDVRRMTSGIDAICSPIYAGAIVYALPRLIRGQRVSYGDALGVGFGCWGRLFAARFIAGLLILVGFVALVVPGIVLSVRFALIDSAVVLENRGVSTARQRSWTLTGGRSWQILGAGVIIFLMYSALTMVVSLPLTIVQQLWSLDPVVNFAAQAVLDCLLDVVYTLHVIVMFLFFWEASGYAEQSAAESPVEDGGDDDGEPFVVPPSDDLNPYRPPSV